jgi:cytoskeletal protein CcmA (bactofilin family)
VGTIETHFWNFLGAGAALVYACHMFTWPMSHRHTNVEREPMMKKTGFVQDENITLLAKGVLIKGEIRVEGTVRIDGRLEGDIHTKGTVVIGEDGVVQGTISAGTLINSGKIKATVNAAERIQLLKTGILIGEIHTPSFAMEDGAKFHGLSDMGVASFGDEATKLPNNVRELPAQRAKGMALVGEGS